ncbi:MAG: hypothetical protein IPG72_07125 [Ardenticatenales bacterium]|nr:hypothetical protein [Ardenticatenales bacterium]
MESLLELHRQPCDPAEPVVCFDECPVQLLGEVHAPLPAKPDQPECQDYEYVQCGTDYLLVTVESAVG